jgi:nitronate monooxygenase
MGAGIPRDIPAVLDRLALHQPVSLPLHVEGAQVDDDFRVHFDPRDVIPEARGSLSRPRFVAVVASASLAATLARKSSGRVDGLVVEMPSAGGHNAPPRGTLQLDGAGEPIYGPRDSVDLRRIAELGLPFWLAGGFGSPEQLREARNSGAAGVQVGTAFALCQESGLAPQVRKTLLEHVRKGTARVFTDPWASPTGFPFKVVRLAGTMSEPDAYASRRRICDLGFLRRPYRREDGLIGWRCPAEPVEAFVRKGGLPAETENRKCLCNGLMANVGMAQTQSWGDVEKVLVTAGDDLVKVGRFLPEGREDYTAAYVVAALQRDLQEP